MVTALVLAALLGGFPPCTSANAGAYWTDTTGAVWICMGTFWTRAPSPVEVTCGGGGSGGAVTIDGGYVTVGGYVYVGGAVNIDAGTVAISNFPTSYPVTGTLWPAAQVSVIDSGTVDARITNFPSSQAVTGTFWQGTQPVSIASMPSTPVTGAFWQATQPVSVASMPTTPVTGTFWQATQPVSLASTTVAGNVAVTHAAASISGSNPCTNPTATILGLSGATSGTSSVQLVALSGSTKIYVCSMNVTGVSGTTPTFKLTYGTGTACATGTTGIVGPWATAANTVYNFVGPTFAVSPAGQALCYVQTGTSPVNNYNVTYAQQ